MILIAFTHSDLPASKGIRFFLGESSHVVVMPSCLNLVAHSNFFGVHTLFRKDFLECSTVDKHLVLPLPRDKEFKFMQIFFARLRKMPYDWGAFFYFTWRALLNKFFGRPYPEKNKWQSRGLLCTEIIEAALWSFERVTGRKLIENKIDWSMKSPDQCYNILKEAMQDA